MRLFLLFSIFFHSWLSDSKAQTSLVISSQPGPMKNKRHFLENGLNRAKISKTKETGMVYWLVFDSKRKNRGGYPEGLIDEYFKIADSLEIECRSVNSNYQITKFVNSFGKNQDKISRFYFLGHATLGDLDVGYINKKFWNQPFNNALHTRKWKSCAFSDSAYINLIGGCRTALPNKIFKSSAASKMQHLTNNDILASDVRVYYQGGPLSDTKLLEKNNGKIIRVPGKRN